MLNFKLAPSTAAIAPQRVSFFGSGPSFVQQRASRPRAAATRLSVVVARVSVRPPCAAADHQGGIGRNAVTVVC